MALIVLALFALFDTPAPYRCITVYGRTECGYRCEATNGDVGCAATPAGVCVTTGGKLTCWDPPEWVRAHYRERLPTPECLTKSGETACGYHCWSHDGDVQCAESPDGVCGNSRDEIKCWDPSPATYCVETGRPLPRPRCVVYDGQIACGYNCETRNGEVACAQTPAGKCIAEHGEVRCFDPPAPVLCEPGKPCAAVDSRSWCLGRPVKP
jgi:hypothetical protein